MADDQIIVLGDTEQEDAYNSLAGVIKAKFQASENARQFDEKRWLRAYRNYRGIYGNDMAFTESEKSKVFVKITKTKVMAAYGQIIEVLFSSGKFPLGIDPTVMPEDIAEYAHVAKESQPAEEQEVRSPYGFPGDGNDLEPGATFDSILGGLREEYGKANFSEGPSKDGRSEPQISPAEISAKNMERLIHDQLGESSATSVFRHSLFEMALLGTGIVKGPFSYDKLSHKWEKDRETGTNVYNPKSKLVPRIEAVSCWDFYPDPDAVTVDDADYIIERHNYTKTQLRDLMNRPFFRADAVRECLAMGPNYEARGYESSLLDRETTDEFDKNRYEILEFWGYLDKELAEQAGLEIDDDMDELDELSVNCWVCNGKILRLVINPFTPARLPYMVCPYEINPYQFFGVGIPENMDDAQTIMNGHARMAIDNLALAGNLVFDVDETMLVPGQDMKVFPGKIFRRQSGQPGQSIHGVKFPNTANENLMMFDRFRQLADESTGIPSYSHGTTGVQSTTRTAAGMSMLMGAAALNIKTVVKNIDDYLLRPLGESMFAWNMQFNEDTPEIRGDLDVKARGTSSLMQKEVRSQRLMTFLQTASNQNLAPFVKWHSVLSEIAKSLDIEPEKLINDPERAAIFAKIMGMANGNQQNEGDGQQPNVAQSGDVPPGANPNDPTGVGGGNIGVGGVPQAGETGFTQRATGTQGTT
jgi:hypothetical protein|tara:strand:- start:1300 stop:3399 length:2100 start_codon:yes stop_codon:yes gene_type:complete